MAAVLGVEDIGSAIKKAKLTLESRSEQISFIHQTLLSVHNIIDIEENNVHAPQTVGKVLYSEGETKKPQTLRIHPQNILRLRRQRQNVQVVDNGQRLSSFWNDMSKDSEGKVHSCATEKDEGMHKGFSSDFNVGPSLHSAVSSLEELCFNDWKWISEMGNSENKEAEPLISKAKDLFEQDCYAVGKNSCKCALQQLAFIKDRCRKLAEVEREVRERMSGLIECYLEADKGPKRDEIETCLFGRTFADDLDLCVWSIEERLHGFEDCIDQLLCELKDWKSERWIRAIEQNWSVLLQPRWLKMLMVLALQFPVDQLVPVTESDARNHARMLKVIYQCFAALPLPLQCTMFQWLWEQPNGSTLFNDVEVMNVHQELTIVFNKLVTGSKDEHVVEIARDLCCLCLLNPSLTLQRCFQEALVNPEAGSMIIKALQCMPFILVLELEGRSCFLNELHITLMECGSRDLTSAEELNLIKFLGQLMKPYRSRLHPDPPALMPPLVSPTHIAQTCVWPFIAPSSYHTGHQQSIPLLIVLKVLNQVVDNGQCLMDSGYDGFLDTAELVTAMLCLLCLLDDIEGGGRGGGQGGNQGCGEGDWFSTKELVVGILHKLAEIVKKGPVPGCISWLVEQTDDLIWTVRMRINALFMDIDSTCLKNVSRMLSEITESFPDPIQSQVPGDTVKELPHVTLWSTSMVSFFQASRISSDVTEVLLQNLALQKLARASSMRQEFYQSVCLALAQVLPHSTPTEWLAIHQALIRLVDEGTLHVSYTTRYMSSLPMLDITAFRIHLSICQVFTSVMQLLSSSEPHSLVASSWQNIVKNYAHVMKVTLEMAENLSVSSPSSSSSPALIILYNQYFCHACEVAQSIPTPETEQLYVWCLELVMRMEEICGCHGNQDSVIQPQLGWQELKTMSCGTENFSSEEQSQTLLHKLNVLSSYIT